MNQYFNFFNLTTFFFGMLWLFIGAYNQVAPDWDYSISIIMGLWAYITAPLAINWLKTKEPKLVISALLLTYLGVDGWYFLYWSYVNPSALFMREVQWFPSLLLYTLAGIIWGASSLFTKEVRS